MERPRVKQRSWEYETIERVSLQRALNDLATAGDDGWELTAVVPDPIVGHILILKRPVHRIAGASREAAPSRLTLAAEVATQRIYVGNLPAWVREEELEQLFGPFGRIQTVVVPSDRETEAGQGFGFVDMAVSDAERAILALHESAYGDHIIQVTLVRASDDVSPVGDGQHAYGSGDGRG
jgi:hypothetical protein